jgi:16S rRNA processing protein RimM
VAGGFGVRGEVRVTAFTADPLALKAYGPLLRADGSVGLTLTTARAAKGAVIGRAKEIETKEQADALRGLKLFVPRERFPAPDEDEVYVTDLIGLEARDPDGRVLGRIKAVQNFGASDMLEITPAEGGQTWYLPFTLEATPELHIADGWILAVRPAEVGEREPD